MSILAPGLRGSVEVLCLAVVAALSACSNDSIPTHTADPPPTYTPTTVPTPGPTSTATFTPLPTATHAPVPGNTPASTNIPQPAPTHTHTPTSVPAPVPTSTATYTTPPAPTHTQTPTYTPTAAQTDRTKLEPALTPASTYTPVPTLTHTPTAEPTPPPTPAPKEAAAAHFAASLPWFVDPPDSAHATGVDLITGMWRRDPELADTVARLAWIVDGMTGNESQAITVLADIAARDTVVALRLPSVLWISDGVTEDEIDAMLEFRRIVNAGTELAARVLDYPWFARDISYDDQRVLYGLAQIGASDTELANRISEMSRVADAEVTTSHLWEPLDDLNIIAKQDRALARQVGDLLSGEFGVRDRHLLSALRALIQESPEAFEQLSNRPWFADGLDDEEAAFLVTTRDILENSPGDFYEMIQSRYTQSKTIDLPLTGNVNIWAIQKTPFPQGENIVADIEDALRSLEKLTLTPLPTTDLIVLIVVVGPDSNYEQPYSNLATPWPGEAHAVSHVRMSRYQSGPYRRHTLFHEVAHYYFEFFPTWFLEGGAEFAADYIWNRNVAGSFTELESSVDRNVGPGCSNGAKNLYQLGTPGMAYLAVGYKSCFYTMGKHFLASLFLSLGEDVTSAALRDVFSQIRSVESRPVTAKDIYLAFQRNIRPGQEDEFGDLFRRLYGGPLADANANVRDDHGNKLSAATPIAMDVVVHGALEHPLDTDYFRFTAEADRDYVLTFSHDIFNDYAGGDLYVRVHPPDGGHPEPLESAGGGESGMRVQWEAPRSGEYRVSLESTVGTTGAYTLQITPVVVHADDHGDDPDSCHRRNRRGESHRKYRLRNGRRLLSVSGRGRAGVPDRSRRHKPWITPGSPLYQSDGTTRAGGYSGGQWGSDIRWRVSRFRGVLLGRRESAREYRRIQSYRQRDREWWRRPWRRCVNCYGGVAGKGPRRDLG